MTKSFQCPEERRSNLEVLQKAQLLSSYEQKICEALIPCSACIFHPNKELKLYSNPPAFIKDGHLDISFLENYRFSSEHMTNKLKSSYIEIKNILGSDLNKVLKEIDKEKLIKLESNPKFLVFLFNHTSEDYLKKNNDPIRKKISYGIRALLFNNTDSYRIKAKSVNSIRRLCAGNGSIDNNINTIKKELSTIRNFGNTMQTDLIEGLKVWFENTPQMIN